MKKTCPALPRYEEISFKLGYIDREFIKLVDSDEFDDWFDEATSVAPEDARLDNTANLYSFIRHFKIPAETVREILVELRNGSENDFSDEEIEGVAGDNIELLEGLFGVGE